MSTDNDFVARLRIRWDAMGDMANDERAAAATEIERLRKERDEARREVCKLEAELPEDRVRVWNAARSPNDLAAKRGWDCFDRSKYAKRRKPIAK